MGEGHGRSLLGGTKGRAEVVDVLLVHPLLELETVDEGLQPGALRRERVELAPRGFALGPANAHALAR
eukprot:4584963-Lingulodinium_polyedra.AAC.1